jgi:hypothetical protein
MGCRLGSLASPLRSSPHWTSCATPTGASLRPLVAKTNRSALVTRPLSCSTRTFALLSPTQAPPQWPSFALWSPWLQRPDASGARPRSTLHAPRRVTHPAGPNATDARAPRAAPKPNATSPRGRPLDTTPAPRSTTHDLDGNLAGPRIPYPTPEQIASAWATPRYGPHSVTAGTIALSST